MLEKYKMFSNEIEKTGLSDYCPMGLDNAKILTNKQTKQFCKDGCSIICPKLCIEFLEGKRK